MYELNMNVQAHNEKLARRNIFTPGINNLLVFAFVEVLQLYDVGVSGTAIKDLNFSVNTSSSIAIIPRVFLDYLGKGGGLEHGL